MHCGQNVRNWKLMLFSLSDCTYWFGSCLVPKQQVPQIMLLIKFQINDTARYVYLKVGFCFVKWVFSLSRRKWTNVFDYDTSYCWLMKDKLLQRENMLITTTKKISQHKSLASVFNQTTLSHLQNRTETWDGTFSFKSLAFII